MSSKDSSKKGKVDNIDSEDDDIEFEGAEEEVEGEFEEPNPNADITLLLKELAEHPEESYDQIAKEMEIPPAKATKTINDFAKHLIGTYRENDFPERMRTHYNSLVKLERNKLSGKDMHSLMSLINRFYAKLLAAKGTPRDVNKLTAKMADMQVPGVQAPHKIQNPQPQIQAPNANQQQQVTFTDASYGGQDQGQGQQQGPPPIQYQQPQQGQQQQDQGQSWAPYDNEESLMKYLLEGNVKIRDPNRIRNFMQMFRWNKNELLSTPQKLLVLLKSSFEAQAAEAVFLMFMDMKHQVSDDPANLYRITGASDYKPVNPINLGPLIAPNNPTLAALIQENLGGGRRPNNPYPTITQNLTQDDINDQKFDRQLERMQKMITMSLMQNMANNSMPGGSKGGVGDVGGMGINPNDYDIYDDYGNDGRVTGRRFIRKAGGPYGYPPQYPGQQDGKADKSLEMMMEFIKMTTQASAADRQLLMQKLMTNDSAGLNDVVGTILKQAVGVIGSNSDPIQGLNKTLELADKMNQIRRPEQPKSMDEKKMELDFILARKDMERSDAKEVREFTRQQEESRSADDRIGHIIDGFAGAAKDVLGPAVQAVTQSFGAGLAGRMPGTPGVVPGQVPPGYPPGYAPVQQPPQKVIIREVPAQQPVVQQPVVQQQPQYNQQQQQMDEIAMAQQQEQIRREQELAQMEAQQDNRPLEEQLHDFADEEIDGLALKMEGDMIHNERAFHKVLAERNRRRLRMGGQPAKQPERKYVSPIVQGIQQHEQEQQQMAMQQNQPREPVQIFDEDENEPYPGPNPNIQEPSDNDVLGTPGTDTVQEPSSTVPTAPDLSDAYENDDITESLRLAGQLQDTHDDTHFGVPSTSSSYVPYNPTATENEPQEQEAEQTGQEAESQVNYDSDDIDMDNDTVVEG